MNAEQSRTLIKRFAAAATDQSLAVWSLSFFTGRGFWLFVAPPTHLTSASITMLPYLEQLKHSLKIVQLITTNSNQP